jgi:uncharacterized protein YbbK (DUF523 family)
MSACLLGEPVRYNAAHKFCDDPIVARWRLEGRIIAVCPEVAGGLGVPRPAAEIAAAAGGREVMKGRAIVIDSTSRDVTREFVDGARHAVEVAQRHRIRVAVLKEGSPSCGSSLTSDGSFESRKVALPGVTTAALEAVGVKVFSELELQEAAQLVEELERE